MDNSARTERSRNAAIEAALRVIARDGPARMTLDAIAREGGMTKGRLMHHFPSKEAILEALMEHQRVHFDALGQRFRAEHGEAEAPVLSSQIATLRQVSREPTSVALALLGALAQNPSLLAPMREEMSRILDQVRAEAADPDEAVLRWTAAQGLALMTLIDFCPFSVGEREQLFTRLLAPAAADRTGTRSTPGQPNAEGVPQARTRKAATPR